LYGMDRPESVNGNKKQSKSNRKKEKTGGHNTIRRQKQYSAERTDKITKDAQLSTE
jgi:hypothetical protein